jgi:hypothetical protein
MRVACAPHFPAAPRALVGSDILQVLGSNGESETVRRVFALSDAAHFATSTTDMSGLLALQPELEKVLERLESRL